jgi:hypothetical protein
VDRDSPLNGRTGWSDLRRVRRRLTRSMTRQPQQARCRWSRQWTSTAWRSSCPLSRGRSASSWSARTGLVPDSRGRTSAGPTNLKASPWIQTRSGRGDGLAGAIAGLPAGHRMGDVWVAVSPTGSRSEDVAAGPIAAGSRALRAQAPAVRPARGSTSGGQGLVDRSDDRPEVTQETGQPA